MLGSQRVFQNTSLPLKNARLTPASRAASTFARCSPDQYSSCPTDRKTLWLMQQRSPACATSRPLDVAHVVPVGLEEPDHRVLGVHEPAAAPAVVRRRVERPVVGDLDAPLYAVGLPGRAVRRARVEAVAAVGVVGLPRLVRRLEDDVGVARVVADDEQDLAAAAGVVADQVREVDARTPRSLGTAQDADTRPVAAVDQARSAGVGQARGLGLRQRRRRRACRGDLAGTVALVVADPQDVDVVRARRGA